MYRDGDQGVREVDKLDFQRCKNVQWEGGEGKGGGCEKNSI